MQYLAPEAYQQLAALAMQYRQRHFSLLKSYGHFNPRLTVDALCFEHLSEPVNGRHFMVGAFITPCELWLVAVPEQPAAPVEGLETLSLVLPSGRYSLTLECLPEGYVMYKRCILEDLSDLNSMQDAARLAQQMMARLMSSR